MLYKHYIYKQNEIHFLHHCIHVAACANFDMVYIGQIQGANVEIILKWVLTVFLTTISNLLYSVCITRLNTNYVFNFAVKYLCCSLVNMLHKCVSKMPSVPHKCRKVYDITIGWTTIGVFEDATCSFRINSIVYIFRF